MRQPAGLEGADGVLQLLHRAVGAHEQSLAVGGEMNRAVRALEQLRAQGGLQRTNLTTHGRLGQEQVLRGHRDAHAPADGHETTEEVRRGEFGERY